MTKKHLIMLAKHYAVRLGMEEDEHRSSLVAMIHDTAYVLAQSNPRLDRNKFLTACGLSPSEKGSY